MKWCNIDQDSLLLCATGLDGIYGGIARVNSNVALALARLGEEFKRPVQVLKLLESCETVGQAGSFGGDKARFAVATSRALHRARLVVFDHAHLALPIVWFPRWLRAKVVILGHGSEVGRRIRPVSRRALGLADLVITNSEHTLRHMRRALSRDDIGVVCPLGLSPHFVLSPEPPTAVDKQEARADLRLRAADGVLRPIGSSAMLIVSRLDAGEREKGHRELIGALPAVRQLVPGAQLVIVGGGSDELELSSLAASSPAASAIFLTGRVPDAVLERLYLAAYAFVMPSRQEGFGLVYLEAMNWALPCVACRGDGGGEVVVDQQTGRLVDQPIERQALVQILVELLANTTSAHEMGVAGWHRLNSKFTSAAHQSCLMGHLRPLAGRC